MDPVTELIQGHFQPRRSDLQRSSPAPPFVSAGVLFGDVFGEVDFPIDTGADSTLLSPQDAVTVLGPDAYRELFEDSAVSEISGIGEGLAAVHTVQLWLFDSSGGFLSFEHEIMVTRLTLVGTGEPANCWMPSLLGRDLLERFRLTIGYHPPEIELALVDGD